MRARLARPLRSWMSRSSLQSSNQIATKDSKNTLLRFFVVSRSRASSEVPPREAFRVGGTAQHLARVATSRSFGNVEPKVHMMRRLVAALSSSSRCNSSQIPTGRERCGQSKRRRARPQEETANQRLRRTRCRQRKVRCGTRQPSWTNCLKAGAACDTFEAAGDAQGDGGS